MNLPVPDVYLYRDVFRAAVSPTGSRQLAILPDLMLLADLCTKGADANAFARELLVNLRSLPAFARIDRASISQLAPDSNMLFVLGSAQGLNCGSNHISTGYHCYIADGSSLTQVREGKARTYHDTGSVLESFRTQGRPAQHSIRLIHEMGHRSGMVMPMELRGSSGFLFLNSYQVGAFDHVDSDAMAALGLVVQIARMFIRPTENIQRHAYRAAEPVSWRGIADEVGHAGNDRFGATVNFRWMAGSDHRDHAFLWSTQAVCKALLDAASVLLGGHVRQQDFQITPQVHGTDRIVLHLESIGDPLRVTTADLAPLNFSLAPWDIDVTAGISNGIEVRCPIDTAFFKSQQTCYSI